MPFIAVNKQGFKIDVNFYCSILYGFPTYCVFGQINLIFMNFSTVLYKQEFGERTI